ncbi:MAG: hypothetical protein IPP48_15695 [Chitinophagaceae bacterium]|nr:hypothetical protein [Chitinophagaceae bacterium]
MKRITLMLLSLCVLTIANAQTTKTAAPAKRTLKKVTEIEMPGDGGSNGGSVVFHPITKKYYIPMLGNASFPFAIFDAKGKLISEAEAGNDLRGLWYNPKTKAIEGNCYDSGGWVRYTVDAKGEIPVDFEIRSSEKIFDNAMKQPTDQSLGVFNAKEDVVYFLYATGVAIFNMKGEEQKTIELRKTKDGDAIFFDEENYTYNVTSVIYTGIPKAEIGILNIVDKKIEFYNKATGVYTTEWKLPEDASVQERFNFAYANNMVWLFDKDNRKWVVYK